MFQARARGFLVRQKLLQRIGGHPEGRISCGGDLRGVMAAGCKDFANPGGAPRTIWTQAPQHVQRQRPEEGFGNSGGIFTRRPKPVKRSSFTSALDGRYANFVQEIVMIQR